MDKISIMNFSRLGFLLGACGIILLIPFVSMQFTKEVNWDGIDFAKMSILLFTTSLVIEIILSNVKSTKNRLLLCSAILLIAFLIWAELAVGIFGSPFAGN